MENDSNNCGGIQVEFLDFTSIEQRDEYEQFVQNSAWGSFTQSLLWCTIKGNWKHEAVIVRNEQHAIVAAMLVLIKRVPLLGTSLLYSPRGPVGNTDKETLTELMDGAKLLARRYNAYLFKCDPFIPATDKDTIQVMQDMGFSLLTGENAIQCRCNYMLNIKNKTADELFQSFHSKWRYNIRLAERKGVTCRCYDKDSIEDKMDEFYPLMQETGDRDGFYIRSKEYLSSLLVNLGAHCRLYMCYYKEKPISGAIAIQYAGKTCYVYGASSSTERQVMPNYLMQWYMIQWAVENGDTIYDFQGIPHFDDESHPNHGVYRFKKGFNGEVVEYAGEFDYLFSDINKRMVEHFYRINKVIQYKKTQVSAILHKAR